MYEKIKSIVSNVRIAVFGKDVRNSIADAIEAINEKTEDLSNRQDCLGHTFESIILEGGNTDAEVIAARVASDGTTYTTIGNRFDELESLVKNLKNDLDNGIYDEISTSQDEPTSNKIKLWIPAIIDDEKEEGTIAPPVSELEPTPEQGTGSEITIIGETKNAVISGYYPEEGQKDSMGNSLVGYPDTQTCIAPSSVALGSKILIKNTGTELDNKIFTVTDRSSSVGINQDGSYQIIVCFKESTAANNFGIKTGIITIGEAATTTTRIATVTANALTVRTGPGTSYNAIGYVSNGHKLKVLETYDNTHWIKVDYNGVEAYVSGNYVTIETVTTEADAVIGEATTNVSKENPWLGIDISHHNGIIDWQSVKKAGAKFAILRIGFGSRKSLGGIIDNQFVNNLNGAKAAGLGVGVYFFSYASSLAGVEAEADWVINQLNSYTGGTFDFPIFFDQEWDSLKTQYNSSSKSYTAVNPGKSTLTSYIRKFYEKLENAGYHCAFYSAPAWLYSYVNYNELRDIPLWLANWDTAQPDPNYECEMWQYTIGNINGVSGQVDLNKCFVDYPSLIRALRKNGF